MGEIGMMYLDYAELGEPPLGVFEAKEKPQRDPNEYRFRLAKARRRVIRERLHELTTSIDRILPRMLKGVRRGDDARLDDPRVRQISDPNSEIERLMDDTAARVGRWSDLHRHIYFGQDRSARRSP
ncbi:hypothetical protein [Segeticoccus rhizosphaerae]|jgi:hypothetical protein|uniref:hypothetical protein n=1 Tax=Segeticoccus rhizosphaerae TaxID=1104777 RepID=UPI001390302E|nr:hypothetical protein [Ornithinicoccus soli]